MAIIDAVFRILSQHGETMTLQRQGETDITFKGKRMLARSVVEEIGNTAAQQYFHVKMGTAEMLASSWASKVPVRSDVVVCGGRSHSVEDVRPLNDSGQTVMYELSVAG